MDIYTVLSFLQYANLWEWPNQTFRYHNFLFRLRVCLIFYCAQTTVSIVDGFQGSYDPIADYVW